MNTPPGWDIHAEIDGYSLDKGQLTIFTLPPSWIWLRAELQGKKLTQSEIDRTIEIGAGIATPKDAIRVRDRRTISTSAGDARCIYAKSEVSERMSNAACYWPEGRIRAEFFGLNTDLGTFNDLVMNVSTRERNSN